jgi:hypothetical protein
MMQIRAAKWHLNVASILHISVGGLCENQRLLGDRILAKRNTIVLDGDYLSV